MTESTRPPVMGTADFDAVVQGLVECACDSDASVRDVVCDALCSLGDHYPDIVLSAIHAFLAKHSKLLPVHRGTLLQVMAGVCAQQIKVLTSDMVALIVNLATQEMTMQKDITEVCSPASSMLVSISKQHCHAVMEALLQKFQPGFQPHIFVVETLGDIALANAFEFIPFLLDILTRTTPLLNHVKQDRARQSFATALGKFCESIREYLANAEKAPDPSVCKEVYSDQVYVAYGILFSVWIQTREHKVRSAVLECLGSMCHILNAHILNEEARRLIPLFLSFYKKSFDPLPVSQGMCKALEAIILSESCPLDALVEDIWSALFAQVLSELDAPISSKNLNEVLRSFHVTAVRYSDRLVYFLLQKLQGPQEKFKIGSLKVIRHLINSSGPYMDDKRSLTLLGLRPVLNDSAFAVKRELCQLSIALADHGYLSADGGQLVVEFLIRQLCLPMDSAQAKGKSDNNELTLRYLCSNALHVLTASVVQAEQVLWPFLFKFLCTESATPALSDICRCLTVLAERMNAEQRLKFQHDDSADDRLPGLLQILARLVVISAVPTQSKRALHALQLMRALSPLYGTKLEEVWSELVPQMLPLLEESPTTESPRVATSQGKWDALVFKLVGRSIDAQQNEEWTKSFAAAMGKQFVLYANSTDERKFLQKCMGGVLMKVSARQFVLDHLDLMFRAVNHQNFVDREGVAVGVGCCASTHTDLVLTKLENEAKLEHQKRPSGFFGFIKDSIPGKPDGNEFINLRATLVLCYGHVALCCPSSLLVDKLDSVISRVIVQHTDGSKETVVREAIMRTLELVYQTLSDQHVTRGYFVDRRSQFLAYIRESLKSENAERLPSAMRSLAFRAATSISKLDPPLSDNELIALLTVCLDYAYSPLPFIDESAIEPLQRPSAVIHNLHLLLEEIVHHAPSLTTLSVLTKLVLPYFTSDQAVIRRAAADFMFVVMRAYYANVPIVIGQASDFTLFGSLLGRLCPRFCDNSAEVRELALTCVHWLFAIAALHLGHDKDYRDAAIEDILAHRDAVATEHLPQQFLVVDDIAKLANQRLSSRQLQLYISVLFEMLADKQTRVSKAASMLMNRTLQERGLHLGAESDTLVAMLLIKLSSVQENLDSYTEMLGGLVHFAEHHFLTVINVLLTQPFPYTQAVCDCWHTLARHSVLFSQIVEHLLDILCTDAPVETLSGSLHLYATIRPLAALTAMVEVFKIGEPESVLIDAFPRLLVQLLLAFGALANSLLPRGPRILPEWAKSHKPLHLVQQAVKTLLVRVKCDHIVQALNVHNGWSDLQDDVHYVDGVSEIARALVAYYPRWVEPLMESLETHLAAHLAGYRVISAAVLAEFVRCLSHQEDNAESIIGLLMSGLADESLVVRKLCVRGMGNVSYCKLPLIEKYANVVLAAIVAGLEDPQDHKDEIAFESMSALSKMVDVISKTEIEQCLLSVLLRIKPCLEKEKSGMRAVAFSLFGHLGRFAEGSESFREQIQNSFVCMIVHSNDAVPEVRKACVSCLQALIPFLMSQNLTAAVADYVVEEVEVMDYRGFLSRVAKALVTDFEYMANFYALSTLKYFSSPTVLMRRNAIMFMGALLGCATPEILRTLSREQIYSGLTSALRDADASIRASAAESAQFARIVQE